MATLRAASHPAEEGSEVPVALRDWDASVWLRPPEFRAWVSKQLPEPPSDACLESLCGADSGARWRFAAHHWAVANGFGQERNPDAPDWVRLAAVGVMQMRSLERARRMSNKSVRAQTVRVAAGREHLLTCDNRYPRSRGGLVVGGLVQVDAELSGDVFQRVEGRFR